jgi:hypothetical protein
LVSACRSFFHRCSIILRDTVVSGRQCCPDRDSVRVRLERHRLRVAIATDRAERRFSSA